MPHNRTTLPLRGFRLQLFLPFEQLMGIIYNDIGMILDSEQSKNIVDRLRRELNPLKIILFGSQTRGNATSQESDVDLCVVVPDDAEHSYKKAVRAYKSLRGLRIPKDIIVRHQSKFEERSHWLNSLEGEISRTGSLLYTTT